MLHHPFVGGWIESGGDEGGVRGADDLGDYRRQRTVVSGVLYVQHVSNGLYSVGSVELMGEGDGDPSG